MSALKLPALDPDAVEEKSGSGYPEPFKSRMGDRTKRRLAAACGMKNLGVNLVTLGPGGRCGTGIRWKMSLSTCWKARSCW